MDPQAAYRSIYDSVSNARKGALDRACRWGDRYALMHILWLIGSREAFDLSDWLKSGGFLPSPIH